ncbi:MAG: RNA 2',3'-cyclic phosphodiesterase [Nitrospira sp.]|nr:RNA 2',3'-cyclic phosphodiesterase [Nitrospira sp.]MCP9462082.1 RNA 2',3'-cyclic phosphodiesterase [Nitrospira sp.]MCP9475171.1 RNA 2',3'-cyclic phosphodiesterase [Nitrospira sp.]
MLRAFLAVELGDELRRQVAMVQEEFRRRLGREAPKAVRIAWVQASSIHLTVKFLGDIDESLIEPMRRAVGVAIQGHRPVFIPLERIGAFPHPREPRVLWVGPQVKWEESQEAQRLAALHRTVEDCCASLGCAMTLDSRPFSPHLTLARVKEGAREVGRLLAASGVMDRPLFVGTLAVESIALIKSDLKPAGPVYTKLWQAGVGGGEDG